jgi:hypothetical protein
MINQDQHVQLHCPRLLSSPLRARKTDREDDVSAPLIQISLHYTVAIFVLLLFLLCSCSGTSLPAQTPTATSVNQASIPASSASSASLEHVNWMNYTYNSSCYGNTQPFHVRHGVAVNNGVHFMVYQPYYGDLTGDAKAEAIIPYQCSAADTSGKHVFVYSGTATHPVRLADLPGAHASNTLDNVMKVSIERGALYLAGVGYSAGAPRCCPDLAIENSYRWTGSTFVLVRSVIHKR